MLAGMRVPPASRLARRRLIAGAVALLAAPAVWHARIAHAGQRPTPAQTEGPFYPVRLPDDTDFDLLVQGERRYTQGEPTWLEGTVSDIDGRAVRGATVEIWQCDQHGHYHHPGDGGQADPLFQGFGRVEVSGDGGYRFHTIRPVPYSGRTSHIHLKVKLAGRELLTTQLYVQGEAGNARDVLWRHLSAEDRALITVPFEPGTDGLHARFAIVVAT
jgi:protocatechuate 3,4-dioxygenase, beta subunit